MSWGRSRHGKNPRVESEPLMSFSDYLEGSANASHSIPLARISSGRTRPSIKAIPMRSVVDHRQDRWQKGDLLHAVPITPPPEAPHRSSSGPPEYTTSPFQTDMPRATNPASSKEHETRLGPPPPLSSGRYHPLFEIDDRIPDPIIIEASEGELFFLSYTVLRTICGVDGRFTYPSLPTTTSHSADPRKRGDAKSSISASIPVPWLDWCDIHPDVLSLILLTLLSPSQLRAFNTAPSTYLQYVPAALAAAKKYQFPRFSSAFMEFFVSIDPEPERVEVWVLSVVLDDTRRIEEYMRRVIIDTIPKMPSSKNRPGTGTRTGTSSQFAKSGPSLSALHIAKDLVDHLISLRNRVEGGAGAVTGSANGSGRASGNGNGNGTISSHGAAHLSRLRALHSTYSQLFRAFCTDLAGVNVHLDGFGSRCKTRFGRGCPAFITSEAKFENVKFASAIIALRVVVLNELWAMEVKIQEALEDGLGCDTCAHRMVNAYDAVMRRVFYGR